MHREPPLSQLSILYAEKGQYLKTQNNVNNDLLDLIQKKAGKNFRFSRLF